VSLGFKFYLANMGETYAETYGVIGSVMVLMLWFYLSGIAILLGAELNAEIEHASPHGKDVGEKVPGQKKKIGIAAMRDYEARRAKGEMPATIFANDENCDRDRAAAPVPPEQRVRPSDLIIGAAALLPAAVKVARDMKRPHPSAPHHRQDDPLTHSFPLQHRERFRIDAKHTAIDLDERQEDFIPEPGFREIHDVADGDRVGASGRQQQSDKDERQQTTHGRTSGRVNRQPELRCNESAAKLDRCSC
jgi:hypothetical protein